MIYDYVLDAGLKPIFKNTPEKTKEWVGANYNTVKALTVCEGINQKLMSVLEYLSEGQEIMFIDVILDPNKKLIYNGTPKQVRAYLKENPQPDDVIVSIGETMDYKSVKDYLEG